MRNITNVKNRGIKTVNTELSTTFDVVTEIIFFKYVERMSMIV